MELKGFPTFFIQKSERFLPKNSQFWLKNCVI